jgi:hypothetical protein
MDAFYDELEKIGAQARSSSSSWSSQTVSAPRVVAPSAETPKAPTVPSQFSLKNVKPASQFGRRQKYSQPNATTTPQSNPTQNAEGRMQPPPNVVFGVR